MTAPSPSNVHPYAAARAVLESLHGVFLEKGHRSWSVSRPNEATRFGRLDLTPEDAWKAMRLLVSKGLAEYMGNAAVVITQYGVSACDHGSLDDELPLPRESRDDSGVIEVDGGFTIDEIERDLAFLRDGELRTMLARDIGELRQALDAGMAKTAVLLCGSILEAVLLDVVARNPALAASHRPKKKFPDGFSLIDFLDLLADEHLVHAKGMASAVIDHRDLIHPAAERRRQVRIDAARAGAMVQFLRVVVHDLNIAAADGTIAAYETK
jgi:hypothetical protein